MKYQLVIIVLLVCSKSLFAQKDTILNIEETTDITTKIYVDVEEKPEFPGGKDGLLKYYENISAFEICKKGNTCRTIYYQIVIDTLGNVGGFNIIKGLNDTYDKETQRIVKAMPKWKPGRKNGTPVKVLVTLDIKYMK